MTEQEWDKKLCIDTIGRDATKEDVYHFPYEPTPYSVLERLSESGYISKENVVVDYGCGKGRVGFFLYDSLGCAVIGVDFDERMYEISCRNLESFKRYGQETTGKMEAIEDKIQFVCDSAENYEIKMADTFYFFNPFSLEILQSVVGKIKRSYYENPRALQMLFYYPSDEYLAFLMTVPELCFVDEIDCRDLFEGDNERERIVIFEFI